MGGSGPARRSSVLSLSHKRFPSYRPMAATSSSDVFILAVGIVVAALYLFRNSIFTAGPKPAAVIPPKDQSSHGTGDPRDFVAKMKAGVSNQCYPLHLTFSVFSYLEKEARYLLWFPNRHRRGVCYPVGQRSKVKIWLDIPRLRSGRVRL